MCWNYFGSIKFCPPDDSESILDKSRYYCSLCLTDIKQRSAEGKACRISDIGSFSLQTSSGNLNMHLSTRHNVSVMQEEKLNKTGNYFDKYDKSGWATVYETRSVCALNRKYLRSEVS